MVQNKFKVIFCLLFIFVNITAVSQVKNPKYRFLYNNDAMDIVQNLSRNNKGITIEEYKDYLDKVKSSGVTTFMLCPGSLMFYYPSKFERVFADLDDPRLIKRWKDRPEDSTSVANLSKYNQTYKNFKEKGTNIIETGVNYAKKIGFETFLTLRMNDLHFTGVDEYIPSQQSEFWLDHPEFRMGDHPGWHGDGGFNYAHKEVRDYKLNLIKEQCELFAIDGYELDFMRFFEYFPYEHGAEYVDLMTNWIKEVRTEINKIAAKKKTHILLSVRIPPRIGLCYDNGLDIKKWVKLNLVDFITVAPHWICDPNMPVKEFRKELGNTKIPVYSTIDGGQFQPYENRTHGILRAVASNYYFQGTDGIYIFNYWFNDRDVKKSEEELALNPSDVATYRNSILLMDLGAPEKMVKKNKLFTLSDGTQETSYKHETPFPIFVSAWEEYKVKLNIPEDFKTNKPEFVCLFLRGTKDSKFKVKVNGQFVDATSPDLAQKYKRTANLLPEDYVYVFKIPYEQIKNGVNEFNLRSIQPKPFFMKRMEVLVSFGDVKQHGYF